MEWLQIAVSGMVSIGLLVSMTEVIAGDESSIGSLKMICGLAVMLSIVCAAADMLDAIPW